MTDKFKSIAINSNIATDISISGISCIVLSVIVLSVVLSGGIAL